MKAILKRVGWFMESLYAEFIDWAKFSLIGVSGVFLAIIIWRDGELAGKAIVIAVAAFIVAFAIIETHSKYLDEKIERERDKIIEGRMENRVDRPQDNVGEADACSQKQLDGFKEGDVE